MYQYQSRPILILSRHSWSQTVSLQGGLKNMLPGFKNMLQESLDCSEQSTGFTGLTLQHFWNQAFARQGLIICNTHSFVGSHDSIPEIHC